MILEFFFIKKFYALQFLPYLNWNQVMLCCFHLFNADVYHVFYIFGRFLAANFDIFLKIFKYSTINALC